LELAARIGQKLLADSQTLRSHNEYLEEQLLQATDKVVAVPAVMVMQYSWYLLVILVPKVLATSRMLSVTALELLTFLLKHDF